MEDISPCPQWRQGRLKRYALAAGFGAVVTLGALGFGHGTPSPTVALAGSGDAPTGTVYVQPSAKSMNLGSTTTAEALTTTAKPST